MILTETPRRKRVTQLVNWGHWFALVNIVIAIIIASIYVFTSPLPGTLLGTLFLFSNWFSHIGFLTFMGFILLILPLCYLLPNAKVVKAVSSTIAATGLALLAFDALLYNRYGLHLSLSSAELIKSETQTVIAVFGWQQWGFLLLLFVVWLSFQIIIANALWQRSERLQKFRLGMPISSFFMLCFVSSHGVHIWADANLYQPIIQQDDMFPLSYPATAKTLMSKYDLLDLGNYQQRKALQFDDAITTVKYPASPVYCGLEQERSAMLLIVDETLPAEFSSNNGLVAYDNHYSFNSSEDSLVSSVLFGLPEIYQNTLADKTPVLLDIPAKLGHKVVFYHPEDTIHGATNSYKVDWSTFVQTAQTQEPQLAIAFVNASKAAEILSIGINKFGVIVTSKGHDNSSEAQLFSNIPMSAAFSSQEDLAPTLLNYLGCGAKEADYSTGQNLQAPKRQWLVATQDDKVIVLHNGHKIEVKSNGHHQIFNRETNEPSLDPLNTGLLSQAMRTLSHFSK